jgi:hypothetical protein
LSVVRHEAGRHFRNKNREDLKDKVNEFAEIRRIRPSETYVVG